MAKKNYDKIIAIRLNSNKKLKHISNDVNVVEIKPSMDLGGIFIFTKEITRRNIKLGYYDAIKAIRKLKGREYYIEPIDDNIIFERLLEIPDEVILEVGESIGLSNIEPKRMLFEFILPNICKYLNLDKESTYQDIVITLFEDMAKERNIEKFKIYSLMDFIDKIKENDREVNLKNRVSISLRGLKRLAIENLSQSDVQVISKKLMDIIKESNL